ncbi:MAG TPA: PAS domain S-box protein [Devosia sp.]|nr:PAS domain S-box protein [Devosia sp.]
MSSHVERADAKVFRFDQSGALLRKVMESAAVGMALVGADKRTIYVNRAYEAMLGLKPGERIGRPGEEILHPDDRAAVMLRFDQVLRGEVEELRLECRVNHADGIPLWVLISASLLRSEVTGRPLYAIVQIINIDRQKRAEAALAESESRWNFALESARQGVWDHDIRTDGMFYSRMWRRMRGIPDDEYVDPAQNRWLARIHPDDVARVIANIERQDRGEDGYDTIEYRERHRDGHWIWILSRGRPVEWDSDGNPTRTVGTDTDITHLKLVESALAAEKERFRVTLHSISDGVISTDSEGRVAFMNPAAEAMTGWREAEARSRPLRDVFVVKSEATGEPATDHIRLCMAAGRPSAIEDDVILVARDGIGRGVSGTAAPVRAADGATIGAVLVFKDATDTQAQKRQLAHSAHHDALTGLPNRVAFAAALAEARRTAAQERRGHALCYVDLDRFKPVNDGAGHAAGDALLQKVAQAIRMSCRGNDFAARIGGDEFVLLLSDCPLAQARRVGQKIVEAVGSIDFVWNGAHYRIGASVGVAAITADLSRDPLAEADAACYAAKAEGRGRVSLV